MSTLGEDLIRSLSEALAHAKGEGPAIVVDRCPDTDLHVGYVRGVPGLHSQSQTLEKLHRNLKEVIAMRLEDGTPALAIEHVAHETVDPD